MIEGSTEKNKIDRILLYSSIFLVLTSVALSIALASGEYETGWIIGFIIAAFFTTFYPGAAIITLLFLAFSFEGSVYHDLPLLDIFGFHVFVMELLFVLLYYALVLHLFQVKAPVFRKKRILVALIVFYLGAFFSSFVGLGNGFTVQQVFHDIRLFTYYFSMIPVFFLLQEKKMLKRAIILLIVFGTIKSAVDSYYSLFLYSGSFDSDTRTYLGFSRLTGLSEIVYPITLIASIILAYFEENVLIKVMFVPSMLLSTLGLYLSYTRGSWLACGLTLLVVFFMIGFYNKELVSIKAGLIFTGCFLVAVLLAGFVGIIQFETIIERFASIGLGGRIDMSNLGRLVEYATALEAFTSNPLTGMGLGFKFSYMTPGIGYTSTDYCHNSYLFVMAKMGAIGIIPFVVLLVSTLSSFIRLLKRPFEEEFYLPALCFCSIFVFFCIKSFTTWHLNTITYTAFVGFLFAVSAIIDNKDVVGNE